MANFKAITVTNSRVNWRLSLHLVSNRKLFVTSSNINKHVDEVLLASTYAAVILINRRIFLFGN